MMYSQGLRLFYSRGLHLLVSKPTIARMALTQQRAFSIYNSEVVNIICEIKIYKERFLHRQKEEGWQKVRIIIRC